MFIWCVGEGMLDLLVPLKGGFVFSAQHFVVLVGGMVQAAELLNSQKCKAPSALWHPRPPPASPQTLFLCPCSKSLSTQQPPSKTLIQSCPSQYRPVRGSYSLIQSTLLTSVTIPDPLCSRESPLWVFFLSLPCPASQAYSSQVTWRIPSLPNSSLLSL